MRLNKKGVHPMGNIKQRGEVSLFVVIFATLLITVVTVSFVRIMMQSQQQASANDLSQSAFDSAQAGVEDAKRAILQYQSVCNSGGDCVAAKLVINSPTCNRAVEALDGVSQTDNEIKIQTGATGNALNQAYTCVKINMLTEDYIGELGQDSSKIIPLIGTGNFDSIKLEWFSSDNLQGSGTKVDVPKFAGGVPLLNQSIWTSPTSPNRPSIMRTQLIQFDSSGFSLNDFEGSTGTTSGSNNTLFLYPSDMIVSPSFINDTRKKAKSGPVPVKCVENLDTGGFACSATMSLPAAVNSNDHITYLNLKSIYKKSSYRITLLGGGSTIKFDGVQPSIDSTGRANDMFRRVQSRVEMTDVNFPYPEAEINITGSLCKDFLVTDSADHYSSNCAL